MDSKEIFNNALNSKYIIIEADDLKSVLDSAELIRSEDTQLSGLIRLLKYDDNLFVQETSFNN